MVATPGNPSCASQTEPCFRSRRAETWSDPIASTPPVASAAQSASLSTGCRIGGMTFARLPAGESTVSVR